MHEETRKLSCKIDTNMDIIFCINVTQDCAQEGVREMFNASKSVAKSADPFEFYYKSEHDANWMRFRTRVIKHKDSVLKVDLKEMRRRVDTYNVFMLEVKPNDTYTYRINHFTLSDATLNKSVAPWTLREMWKYCEGAKGVKYFAPYPSHDTIRTEIMRYPLHVKYGSTETIKITLTGSEIYQEYYLNQTNSCYEEDEGMCYHTLRNLKPCSVYNLCMERGDTPDHKICRTVQTTSNTNCTSGRGRSILLIIVSCLFCLMLLKTMIGKVSEITASRMRIHSFS